MRRLLSLTKPGIIIGNIITLLGGYFVGSQQGVNLSLMCITIVGMALIMACGCAFNNYIDRDIDVLMEKTRNRVLVSGQVSATTAVVMAIILGVVGVLTLYFATNILALIAALCGLFFYVILYSLWFKRHSIYGTLIGAVAGAMPPVVGYCAASNQFNIAAVILFMILFLWQVPHFYAIAIYRQHDYIMAAIPVLPIKRGIACAKIAMVLYIGAFSIVVLLPTLLGYTNWFYFSVALFLSVTWLTLGISGFTATNSKNWARKMFLFSIIVITLLSIMMIIGVQ